MAPLRILAALALTVGSAAAFSPVAPFAARTAVSTPRYDLKVTSPNITSAQCGTTIHVEKKPPCSQVEARGYV
jgi:hypothetical protein